MSSVYIMKRQKAKKVQRNEIEHNNNENSGEKLLIKSK